ncbi:DUF6557 family protein [Acidaminobacter hydrogenoformans]|uniref:Uncharacterized protein n=1 Tax=Acidaminobacter hydrogenoformans DSM 2784 TaxID=1120920 RepID=A0A1G5RUD7_9FIRM|nr:DUF6557 family protein [Acidaminobacter hydrogenoformans]SCZ77703.1 hypothetical protein SAMN03080599_00901 [Acidaminobacter hydrogenoformans DSM 2784]
MAQNAFMDRMEKLTDEQLREVILIQYEDYTQEALEAAKAVAEARGILSAGKCQEDASDSGEAAADFGVPETFLGCLKAVDFKSVEKKLYGTFKEPDRVVEQLRVVYQNLLTMEPEALDPPVFMFLAQLTSEYVGRYPFDVFGIEEGTDEPFGLEIMPWKEWLGLKVYEKTRGFVEKLGLDEFVALCLRKMTVLGYTEEEIEAKVAEMTQYDFEFDEDEDEAQV